MKKFYILFLAIFLSIQSAKSQNASLSWQTIYGSAADENYLAMSKDADGNIFVTGYFSGTCVIPNSGGMTITSAGQSDIVIAKFTPEGTPIWFKTIGAAQSEEAVDITTDAAGNIYVVGSFSLPVDMNPAPGANNVFTLNPYALLDVFILKLDNNGNFVWAKKIASAGDEEAAAVTIDEQGNLIHVGYFKGTVDFNPGTAVNNLTAASGYYDCFIQKLSSDGNFIWAKKIGGTGDDYLNAVTIGVNNSILLGGAFKGTADFDPSTSSYNLVSAGLFDAYLCSLTQDGNFMWAKRYGADNDDDVRDIILTDSKNIYVTGGYLGNVNFNGTNPNGLLTQIGNYLDVFVLSLQTDGTFIWAKKFGGTGFDVSFALGTDLQENVYISGSFQYVSDFDPGVGVANLVTTTPNDGFVAKLTKSGNYVWARQFGKLNTGTCYPRDMTLDNFGNVYTTGAFSGTCNFNPGSGTPTLSVAGGGFDGFVNKMFQCKTQNVQGDCNTCLNLSVLLSGYTSSQIGNVVKMKPVLMNESVVNATNFECDDLTIELHQPTAPYALVASTNGRLNVSGYVNANFSSIITGAYYVVVKHRNSIETWSANPVTISNAILKYDFSKAIASAYGSNEKQIGTAQRYGLFTGDLNQDGIIDNTDFALWETDANSFATGYLTSDIEGDGLTDNSDFALWETNSGNFVGAIVP
jgi:hypothetical protein